jgi:hypothetical protein
MVLVCFTDIYLPYRSTEIFVPELNTNLLDRDLMVRNAELGVGEM